MCLTLCQSGAAVSLIIMVLAMAGGTAGEKTMERHNLGDDFEALTSFLAWSVNEDTASLAAAEFPSAMRLILNQLFCSLLLASRCAFFLLPGSAFY